MKYNTESDIVFVRRKVGRGTVSYRLMSSGSERGGNFILVSSRFGTMIEDAFVPYVSESRAEAEDVFRFLYENGVTPCTVFEVLDDRFASK